METQGICLGGGYEDGYGTLDAAKNACHTAHDCVGVYDLCGGGNNFGTCTTSVTSSGCGSIFFHKPAKTTGLYLDHRLWGVKSYNIYTIAMISIISYIK